MSCQSTKMCTLHQKIIKMQFLWKTQMVSNGQVSIVWYKLRLSIITVQGKSVHNEKDQEAWKQCSFWSLSNLRTHLGKCPFYAWPHLLDKDCSRLWQMDTQTIFASAKCCTTFHPALILTSITSFSIHLVTWPCLSVSRQWVTFSQNLRLLILYRSHAHTICNDKQHINRIDNVHFHCVPPLRAPPARCMYQECKQAWRYGCSQGWQSGTFSSWQQQLPPWCVRHHEVSGWSCLAGAGSTSHCIPATRGHVSRHCHSPPANRQCNYQHATHFVTNLMTKQGWVCLSAL